MLVLLTRRRGDVSGIPGLGLLPVGCSSQFGKVFVRQATSYDTNDA